MDVPIGATISLSLRVIDKDTLFIDTKDVWSKGGEVMYEEQEIKYDYRHIPIDYIQNTLNRDIVFEIAITEPETYQIYILAPRSAYFRENLFIDPDKIEPIDRTYIYKPKFYWSN